MTDATAKAIESLTHDMTVGSGDESDITAADIADVCVRLKLEPTPEVVGYIKKFWRYWVDSMQNP